MANKSIIITGANSGLGYEAARQLAHLGYTKIILACRSEEKAKQAQESLKAETGVDPFETLAIDVSSADSAKAALKTLVSKGEKIDQLLLNAGVVPGDELKKTDGGLEVGFAASLIGHHILATGLLENKLISDNGRIVLISSEGARNDLPAMMGLKLYDFAHESPVEFGKDIKEAMINFAKGARPDIYEGMRQYATVKLFSVWWAAKADELYGENVSIFAVSPGASMGTNAARNVEGFKKFLFTKIMPLIGPKLGMDQSVEVATKRYVDVLMDANGSFEPGAAYMSAPKKMVGPMIKQQYDHFDNAERREIAWQVIQELSA